MGLKIFGDNAEQAPAKKTYANDHVGRLRSGFQTNGRPASLNNWRVTTDDPDVAAEVQRILGGEEPRKWEAHGDDNIEVFTSSPEIALILEGEKALRQSMALYGRNGIIFASDGETITYPPERLGEPDPQAGQDLKTRKAAAKQGTGSEPKIEIFGRLAQNPDLGIFKFQSASWSMVSDLDYHGVEDAIADIVEKGQKVKALLCIETVEFVAKTGDRAGQTVSYNKPVLKIVGAL